MLAEWRSNLWLFIELLIVSLVLWWINDYFYVLYSMAAEPDGFDTRNVYKVDVVGDWRGYHDGMDADSLLRADLSTLVSRLKAEPGVEAVSLTTGLTPHNFNFSGSFVDVPEDSTLYYGTADAGMVRIGTVSSGDICRVLDVHGVNGETPAQLDSILRSGKAIASSNASVRSKTEGDVPAALEITPGTVVGRRFAVQAWNNVVVEIGAVVLPMKRATYEPADYRAMIILPPTVQIGAWGDIMLRVNPEYPGDFVENIRGKLDKDYALEATYVSDVENMEEVRAANDMETTQEKRKLTVVCLFLMCNVFLGLLGAFWFRTQQRASEIAIRMVNGASPRRVIGRIVSEALLMLAATLPLVAGGVFLMVSVDKLVSMQLASDSRWLIFLIVGAITYAQMAVMVVLGVIFPAIRAMRTNPSEVLKDE